MSRTAKAHPMLVIFGWAGSPSGVPSTGNSWSITLSVLAKAAPMVTLGHRCGAAARQAAATGLLLDKS
ncbi:hypothetical protein [Parafrankia sp. CH37]|uniref:hypothetical protein n=1 Tax=Parafrankia sp. CH37 TaxID=683308 RepID=UPI001D01F596|nr:hypothetical protein [Parafrankia sp. CH37]